MKLTGSEIAEIRRMSESRAIASLIDSVLHDLDSKSLAELLSAYLYLRAKGMTNIDYLAFVATWRFPKGLMLLARAAAAFPSLLLDDGFRSMVAAAIEAPRVRKRPLA